MAAMPPAGSTPGSAEPPAAPPGAPEVQRQARYNHLVGRLRGRQITMEEATELFALMQAMLRASEAARRTLAPPPPMVGGVARPAPARGREAPGGGSDDLFLVGLLAMGAGAGLLAAMARRLADGDPNAARPARPPAPRPEP